MGIKDRIAAKYADRDWNAEVAALLDDGDVLLGWATGRAAAAERRTTGMNASARLQSFVITGVQNSLSKANHVGGEKGSIAASLPLQSSENAGTLVLSAFGLSVWHFGYGGGAPTCTLRIPSEDITSITRTDARGHRGYDLARVLFRDNSFFDYYVSSHETFEPFWAAAALVRPSA